VSQTGAGRGGLRLRGRCAEKATRSIHRTWLRTPDVAGILRDGAVAGELAGTTDILDRAARPGVGLEVKRTNLLLGPDVRREVGQMHVAVALRHERVPDRGEDPRLVRAEGVRGDQVQRAMSLGLVVVVPAGAVPGAALRDLFGGQAEEEEVR